jgi:uncharacterized membrane protein HdeD (DUF308 family)
VIEQLTRYWWAFALRGIVAILFGVVAFLMPGITLYALVLLFGAFAIVDGAFAAAGGLRRGSGTPDWFLVAGGVLGVVAGVIALVWPAITALVLLAVIAAWAIATGVIEIVAAYRLREVIKGEALLALNGVVSVIFGVVLILFPGAGAIAVIWLIAAYAIASGIMLLLLAFRLRAMRQDHSRPVGSAT